MRVNVNNGGITAHLSCVSVFRNVPHSDIIIHGDENYRIRL